MIVDASVALKWFVPAEEDGTAAANLVGMTLVAPALILIEIGNALWKKKRRGLIAPRADLQEFVASVEQIVSIRADVGIAARALEIACLLDHPVYDCVYLALAESIDDHVVTADRRFIAIVSGTPFEDRVRALA